MLFPAPHAHAAVHIVHKVGSQQFGFCAGIAAVAGTIAARVAMGAMCDWIGPRLGMSVVLLMSAPCVFGMAMANKAIDFIMLRFGIGFGLSTFVACQFWTACMFNVKIVGMQTLLAPLACVHFAPTLALARASPHHVAVCMLVGVAVHLCTAAPLTSRCRNRERNHCWLG